MLFRGTLLIATATGLLSTALPLGASEPVAEWTFSGKDPLKDAKGGLVATPTASNPEGSLSSAGGALSFTPRVVEGITRGGTLEIPWDKLVARFQKGFSLSFTMTYASLDRGVNGKDLGIIDTSGRRPGPFRFGVNQGPNGDKYYVRLTTDPTGDPSLTMVTDRLPSEVGRPIDVLISVGELKDDQYEIKLFLDDKLIKSEKGTVYPLFEDTSLVIGSYVERGTMENFFDGTISNLRIQPAPVEREE